jgi:hypothetical protein
MVPYKKERLDASATYRCLAPLVLYLMRGMGFIYLTCPLGRRLGVEAS